MRAIIQWSGALVVTLSLASRGPGAEPSRPTTSPSETNPAVPAAGHSVHGEAFDDGPRQLATLLPGMGKVQFPVTTAKPEAQAFINQGVAQLHSFYYFESERSFRQAALIDPDCAMAYWGMAMSNVNNPRRAQSFLKEARKRDAKLSQREKLYLDAIEELYKTAGDEKSRKQAHLDGLEAIVHEFSDDIDARAWMAMVTWQNGSITSRKSVDTVIETVLQTESMHPGAHHYRIHLWDGNKPKRAEKSAATYASTAPGIAHAWHMPGHTYTSLRQYANAAYQQEGSARVDHAAMARDRIMPFEIHNYAHNNQWLCTSLSHIGRARDAIAVARNLVEQPRDPDRAGKNDGGSPQRTGRLRWSEVLTRYELWDDLIAATNAGDLDWSDVPAERRERAYTLGLACAAKGDRDMLAQQVDALKGMVADEAKKAPKTGPASTNSATQTALAELEGYQALASGDYDLAFERFARASSMRPEALARAHLAARNFGFAESAAKKAVAKQPEQVAPLAAEVEILQAVGKVKDAQAAYRKLLPLAKAADPDLPVFRRISTIVEGWKADGGWSANDPEPATDDATAHRIDLTTLGPLTWAPYAAEPFARPDTKGKTWSLADHKGKNVVILFYLGGKCAHCMQQLQVFGKEAEVLRKLGTELVAISTDDLEATRALKANPDGVKFPMPMLPDPRLELFKAYRSFDDFESQPLHGTFLIDADGRVRYQRIAAEPFLDVDFIKAEAARANRLVKRVGVNY
jgi:peroxiredoxin